MPERVITALLGAFAILLGAWGSWLLLTEDVQGGRHLVGSVMLGLAVGSGVMAVLAYRRLRR